MDLKSLHFKRGNLKARLTNTEKYLSSVQNIISTANKAVLFELESRYERFNPILDEFYNLQNQIDTLEDKAPENAEYCRAFEDDFFKLSACFKTFILECTPEPINSPNNGTGSESAHSGTSAVASNRANIGVKLPVIDLPKFDGNFVNWLEYRDGFRAMIHDNDDLNSVQKYHYLRASLVGKPSQLIKSLPLSEANYSIAWDIICSRYDNKRGLIKNYIKSIFHISACKKPSADGLRNIVDSAQRCMKALESLEIQTENWDLLIIYILVEKLDDDSADKWDEYELPNDFPSLADFIAFVESRANRLEDRCQRKAKPITGGTPKESSNTKAFVSGSFDNNCKVCKGGNHYIYKCDTFLNLEPARRLDQIRELKLCINCLRSGHTSKTCKSSSCRKCNQRHNSLLHFDRPASNVQTAGTQAQTEIASTSQSNTQSYATYARAEVLLSTALVDIVNSQNRKVTCRALLDCGSQSNFISQDCLQRLSLSTRETSVTVTGINQVTTCTNSMCNLSICSKTCNFTCDLSCYVVPEICSSMPSSFICPANMQIPSHIKLADAAFNQPSKIDILIGAEWFWQLLCIGQIKLGPNMPTLQKTRLGWVVSGTTSIPSSRTYSGFTKTLDIQEALSKFWELEECNGHPIFSDEQISCENHFVTTIKRHSNGRFIASLPLKQAVSELGESQTQAVKRFQALQRKFVNNPQFKADYTYFMREYIDSGHMTKLADDEVPLYVLPHHGVIKEDSVTTKLRVVFDGSAPTTSGKSLNDIQMVGPTIQPDLCSILLRFRQHKYVVTADISKMYRQVSISPDQRLLQCILWTFDESARPDLYKLNTVTYGTASASFLAIRCLKQLALENQPQFPLASQAIVEDFYVDDFLSGSDDINETINLCEEVSHILSLGCFPLRKWMSNSNSIINDIASDISSSDQFQIAPNETCKTLGITWSSKHDILQYHINLDKIPNISSKRSVLSTIAQIFDPLGLLGACIITAKIILQKLWIEKLSWDESLPLEIHNEWSQFRKNLWHLNHIEISRHVVCDNYEIVEIHGFADASERAYGACVYLRSMNSFSVSTRLLMSKSKVAPLKSQSIPRLELCAALLLAEVVQKVKSALRLNINSVFCWSDSSIVLSWLQTPAHTLKPFVANRVTKINAISCINTWQHVKTAENPADIISRGINPNQLTSCRLWWHGPQWLQVPIPWTMQQPELLNDVPELRPSLSFSSFSAHPLICFERFSTFAKLNRTIAYCHRFIYNCRNAVSSRRYGSLSVEELDLALTSITKVVQASYFGSELQQLKSNSPIQDSNISSLSPFLDKNGIIRVGGRLINANISDDRKHPILLPSDKCHVTKLLFTHEHLKMHHAGPQQTLYSLRERFWPILGRNAAKHAVHNCSKCYRLKPTTIIPLMGNLPKERVCASLPFTITGVDYAGPFLLKDRKGRGAKTTKCWIALFICFSTKAVHLELVTDLTSDAFLATLRRFISRRGKPRELHSDNATNFVGANNELTRLRNFITSNSDQLSGIMATEGITWKFIPPHSPSFGGLWEINVKQMKYHLRRVLGEAKLTFEEFLTLSTQIEAILNSRPISPMSSDPNDLHPLTPGHFLIGRALTSTHDVQLHDVPDSRLCRYEYIQKLREHFWKRWSKEYLNQLQQRPKRARNPQHQNLSIGDLVILKEDNLSPLMWKLGRVTALHMGSDNYCRVVSVKTANGNVTKRAVSKLCKLNSDN